MEKEFSEPLSSSDFQTMDESLEFIFTTMVDQGEMLDAVEFIRSIEVQFLPSTTTMKTLIFQIIMNSDDIKTIAFATDYLYTVIKEYPPVNEKRRKFYFDSIRDDQGYLADLWTVFSHIVISNIIQKGIYVVENNHTDPIKYPNCKFLLEFYIKLFMADFHHYKSDNSTICLISKLFWPNSDIRSICLSNQTNTLFKWINDIYASASVNEVPNLIESMHQMLTLVVRCIIEGKHNFSESEAFSSAPLAEIVVSIAHNCKDAFSNLANVKKFLNFIPNLKYLRMKLCEKLIKQLIKVSSRKYSVLTLKDIVEQCMFPSRLATLKNNNKTLVKEKKELRRRVVDKKYFTDMKMETTKLHELCRKNKFADLLEELTNSSDDINARDPNGNTPLHEACSVGSRLCVRHLIDEGCSGTAQTLDFAAFNLEGVTPLHVAVVKDFVDIAKMLLSFGGAELLTMSDNKGQLPADLSKSDSMDKLLQEYDSQLCAKLSESSTKDPTESDSSTSTESALLSKENLGSAPSLKSFREYSIYLDCLTCLLCTYCDMFNLHDYVWQKNTIVSSHNDKSCCHYVDKDVCSEDAAIISELPSLIETFMESITKNASKSELLIDIELIPLKAFVASLKTS